MKDKQAKIGYDGEELFVRCKRKVYRGLFADPVRVVCVSCRFVDRSLSCVCVSHELFRTRKEEKLVLVNAETGNFINVTLLPQDGLGENEIRITGHVAEQLLAEENAELLLCRYKKISFGRVLTQKIEHIRENDVVLSEEDYRAFGLDALGSFCDLFEFYNTVTKDSVIVKSSHIYTDAALPRGSIRLNRKQRFFLGMELPLYLSPVQREILGERASAEEQKLLGELYGKDHTLLRETTYEQQERAKKIISARLGCEIRVIPVIESVLSPERKSLLHCITDFYVGKSTVSLICRRPYENDEGLNVVRLTKSNMKLLGIEEMDKVYLKYKKKQVACRVLELDNEKEFFRTNLPAPTELSIGIPSHIRKKLGITALDVTVKVDRDTAFILKRSMNEQIVPILLTLFSTSLFSRLSTVAAIVITVLALPVVLYLNLSTKRNMRA